MRLGKRERAYLKAARDRAAKQDAPIRGPLGYASACGQVVPTIAQSLKWGHDARTKQSIYMRDALKRGYRTMPVR